MLHVFLGYACNLRCSYCLQVPYSSGAARKKADARKFVDKMAPYMREKGIDGIAYWGGEPSIYWDQIEAIHAGLLAAGVPLRRVQFTTNGTLLDDHQVARLNEWGAYVSLSDHAEFGTPNWEMVGKLNQLSMSFVFSKQLIEPYPILLRLREVEQLTGRRVFGYVRWVRATDGCDPRFYFTMADLPLHFAYLRELADLRLAGDFHAHSLLEGHLRKMVAAEGKPAKVRCYGDHFVAVDLAGNRYSCHHYANKDGMIENLFTGQAAPHKQAVLAGVHKWAFSKECRECAIASWCQGNCHLSKTHEVDCALTKGIHEVLQYVRTQEGDK